MLRAATRITLRSSVVRPLYHSHNVSSNLLNGPKLTNNFTRHFSSSPVSLKEIDLSEIKVNEIAESVPGIVESVPTITDTAASAASQSIEFIAPRYGELEACGLGSGFFTGPVEFTLVNMTVATGCTWFTSIAVTSLALRFIMGPLQISSMKNSFILMSIKPEMEAATSKIKMYQKSGEQDKMMMENANLKALMKERGCNPLKSIVPIIFQMPVMMSVYFALRDMSMAPLPSFTTGGILWFPDLSVPDPTYLLPCLAAAGTLATMESSWYINPPVGFAEKLVTPMRAMCVMTVPITMNFPAGILVYWVTSTFFAFWQTLALANPKLRTLVGLPQIAEMRAMQAKQSSAGPASAGTDSWAKTLEDLKASMEQKQENPAVKDQAVKEASTQSWQQKMDLLKKNNKNRKRRVRY